LSLLTIVEALKERPAKRGGGNDWDGDEGLAKRVRELGV
jgi:hypothetical protein